MMFSHYKFLSCAACGMFNNNQTEHIILYCSVTECYRKELWQRICRAFGFDLFSRFKPLQPADQILSLFSFMNNIESDEQHIKQCQRFIICFLDGMAKLSSFKT